RIALLAVRNKLKTRVSQLEGRLTKADDQFSYATDDLPWEQEFDPMPSQHVPLYLDLLAEYEVAYDALERANASL
ncbi:MAG TPA: hypothetical protein VFG60_09830, partial [Burkholderiaceae bacterium]|nr:hypothetical protein [Burkholderiaceae bacterium]